MHVSHKPCASCTEHATIWFSPRQSYHTAHRCLFLGVLLFMSFMACGWKYLKADIISISWRLRVALFEWCPQSAKGESKGFTIKVCFVPWMRVSYSCKYSGRIWYRFYQYNAPHPPVFGENAPTYIGPYMCSLWIVYHTQTQYAHFTSRSTIVSTHASPQGSRGGTRQVIDHGHCSDRIVIQQQGK